MAVIYKARQAVIANKEGKKLYHPMVVLTGSVKLEQIANDCLKKRDDINMRAYFLEETSKTL